MKCMFVSLQIFVRSQTGSSVNFADSQKKTITLVREQFYANVDESTTTETTHDLDENGHCYLTLDVAKNESSFSLKVDHSQLAISLVNGALIMKISFNLRQNM